MRRATPDDLDAIAAVFTRSRSHLAFLPILHTQEEDRAFWRDVVLATRDVRVGLADDRIGGVIATHAGWIEQLYVDPDALRLGIGSALVASAKRGMSCLDLWCFAENEGALAFYAAEGFTEIGRTDGAGNEENCPDVHLRWRTGPDKREPLRPGEAERLLTKDGGGPPPSDIED